MSSKFDLTKVYTRILSKKDLLKYIRKCYDEEFIVSFLPTTEDNADIFISSVKLDCKKEDA